jgi:hypothetical protein
MSVREGFARNAIEPVPVVFRCDERNSYDRGYLSDETQVEVACGAPAADTFRDRGAVFLLELLSLGRDRGWPPGSCQLHHGRSRAVQGFDELTLQVALNGLRREATVFAQNSYCGRSRQFPR